MLNRQNYYLSKMDYIDLKNKITKKRDICTLFRPFNISNTGLLYFTLLIIIYYTHLFSKLEFYIQISFFLNNLTLESNFYDLQSVIFFSKKRTPMLKNYLFKKKSAYLLSL